jgi:hypothetical protein
MNIRVVPAESEIDYSEEHNESLARSIGKERAAWARLPREEREKERRWCHDNFNTPDDLAIWPSELDDGKNRA